MALPLTPPAGGKAQLRRKPKRRIIHVRGRYSRLETTHPWAMNRLLIVSLLALGGCLNFDPPGLITFVIDDGQLTDYTVKRPIFDARGAVAVSAVITRHRHLSDAQLLAMQADGWEIASHSRTHIDEPGLTPAQLEDEIGGARQDLEAIGLTVTTHVYPHGLTNFQVEQVTKKYYDAGVTVGGPVNTAPFFLPALGRKNFGRTYARPGRNTLDYYETLVDGANHPGRWLIFMVHEVDSTDAATLGHLLDYIRARSIPIVTIREGIRRFYLTAPRVRSATITEP